MDHFEISRAEKYENIIRQIEEEHARNDSLRQQIEQLNSKIVASGITLKKNFSKEKIFKVLVKVFASVFDVYELYSEKINWQEIESLSDRKNCKFCFVEIHVSRMFQEKILNQNWLVNVRVQNSSKLCVNKNVNVKNKVLNPICVVVPFDAYVRPSAVDVTITWPSDDGVWPYLKIASVPINILHHAELYSGSSLNNSLTSNVINISRLYNPHLSKNVLKLPVAEYKLPCTYTSYDLFKIVTRNCYHRLDVRKKSVFSTVDDVTAVKFSTGSPNLVTVKLNTSARVLRMEASLEDLCLLKKYFIEELQCETYDLHKNTVASLSVMKNSISADDPLARLDLRNLTIVYNDLRRLLL